MVSKYDFADTFGIQNPRQMILGGILIDTDERAGWEVGMKPRRGDYVFMNPYQTLKIFPEGMIFSDDIGDKGLLFAETWFNGFAYPHSKVYNSKNVAEKCVKWLNKRGYILFKQELTAKSPLLMNPLFAHMSWYGDQNSRFATLKGCSDDSIKRLKESGYICSFWKDNPVQVRYVIKKKQESETDKEFVYLLGGSTDVLNHEEYHEILPKIIDYAKSCGKRRGATFSEEMKKSFVEWRSSLTTLEPLPMSKKEWAHVQYMHRFSSFINLARNFVLYGKKILGENNYIIYELNGKTKQFTEISTDEIINRFNGIYEYLKTITLVYRTGAIHPLG